MPATLEISAPAPRRESTELDKRRVLLVDHDPINRQTLRRLLTREGYSVITAANGSEALEQADAMTIDLVVLDLDMPLQDGWNTFERLSARNSMLPVILIAACSNQFFPAAASGVGALLEKPLNFLKLFSTMQVLLEEPAEMRMMRWKLRTSIFCYIPSSI